jgi:TIR domain
MALVTEAVLKGLASERRLSASYRFAKSADAILREAASTNDQSFDVFLSHSFQDAELVLGVYELLSRQGLKVYVDWIVDQQLDRSSVQATTAEQLRTRMRQSRSLIYAHSTKAGISKWMPWELGYFDGFRQTVAILPIAQTSADSFAGQEYLGLYPYIDGSTVTLWVNRGSASERLFHGAPTYKSFKTWLTEQRAA